jgi:hypothetical protein
MNRLMLAAALLAATTVAADAQAIGGAYAVEGTGLNGAPYGGTAQINALTDTTCEIIWQTGPQTSNGVCMRYGPAFSAFYVIEAGGQTAIGLVIYEVMQDGSMEGIWTVTGQNGSGTEKLTPQ